MKVQLEDTASLKEARVGGNTKSRYLLYTKRNRKQIKTGEAKLSTNPVAMRCALQ